MTMRFVLKHITQTYSDPRSSMCALGRFDGEQTMFSNLVLEREGILGAQVKLNNFVFREVLLSNPILLEKMCGVTVMDKLAYDAMRKKIEDLEAKLKKGSRGSASPKPKAATTAEKKEA